MNQSQQGFFIVAKVVKTTTRSTGEDQSMSRKVGYIREMKQQQDEWYGISSWTKSSQVAFNKNEWQSHQYYKFKLHRYQWK